MHTHACRYLLNLCHILGASSAAASRALCLLNDSLVFSSLCLTAQPADLAAAALLLAVTLLQEQLPGAPGAAQGASAPASVLLPLVGLSEQDADALAAQLLDLLVQPGGGASGAADTGGQQLQAAG